jgi:thiosulfate dehydrogenase [quinone] large subunit
MRDAGRTRPQAPVEVHEPRPAHRLLADTRSAWVWLLVRLYVGGGWLAAGVGRLRDPALLEGHRFAVSLRAALSGASGHAAIPGWYAAFLRAQPLAHPVTWAHAVAWAEVAVGLAVLLGAWTGVFAFLGLLLNFSHLLAGSVSVDPLTTSLAVALVLAWRVAGWWGLDRWILPVCGCSLRADPGA